MAWWTSVRSSARAAGERIRGPWTPNDPLLGGTAIGWRLVGTLGALLGPTAVLAYIIGSYLQLDVQASLSMIGDDGTCDLRVIGFGTHCWGDFTSLSYSSPVAPLSLGETLYPISTRIVRLPFWAVGQLFGLQAALIVYLFVSALCILTPVIWAVRHAPLWAKALVISVLGIATMPFLFAWDRGNILSLTVPFLFIAFLGLVRNRHWWVVIGVIAAASVKPQFAVLAFVLFALRDVKRGLVAVGGSVLVVVGSYALLGAGGLPALQDWIGFAAGWSSAEQRELFWPWPGNGSIPRALYMIVHLGPWANSSVLAAIPDSSYVLAGQSLFAVLTVLLIVVGRRLPPLAIGAGLIVMSAFFLTLSFGYYFVVVLPVAAIVFREGIVGWPVVGARAKVLVSSFFVALVLSITPMMVPTLPVLQPEIDTFVLGSLTPSFAILAWVVFIVTLVIEGFTLLRRGREEISQPVTAP